jgi:ATP adenylyltransferase
MDKRKPPASDLKRLWAPWRSTFVREGPSKGCFLCAAARPGADRRRYVVTRRGLVFGVLNRFPYNNGHIMVAPRRHVAELDRLRPEEWLEMLEVTTTCIQRLKTALRPHGINAGFNLGRVAGAGVPGHLHLHLVPRWSGDTNFMPVLGSTKVLNQSLEETHHALRDRASSHPRSRR